MEAKVGFRENVADTQEIASCFKEGLGGVKGADKSKIVCPNTRDINGSVDIDGCLAKQYPSENRWDYAIGYQEKCYFVEIHPASTSEIDTVINKLTWLKAWLKKQRSPLLVNHAGFYWVASGKVSINKNSPQARKLATSGMAMPARHCRCDK